MQDTIKSIEEYYEEFGRWGRNLEEWDEDSQ